MNKYKTILCCMFLILCAGCDQPSENPSRQTSDSQTSTAVEQNDNLHELSLKVEKDLPTGWAVSLSPSKQQLLVALATKSTVVYRTEATFRTLKSEDEKIEIKLDQTPFVTIDEYDKQKRNNQLARQKRIVFEEEHLSHLFDNILKRYKISSHPYPPEMYDPQTTNDKQLVTEYKTLWNDSKPAQLPTHRFKSTSLRIKHYPIINAGGTGIYIVDKQIAKQHDEILASLNKLLSNYESLSKE